MRDDVMAGLVERVLTDEGFRQQARDDLDTAMTSGGFELQPDEMAAVREFRDEYLDMTDGEFMASLQTRRQGAG